MAQTNHRPPVLSDVAREAGVSVPTVSRVLTGSTPVSEAKRQAVAEAIERLGYRPNAAARALVSGRRSMIAVLAGRTSDPGSAGTIQGIVDVAREVDFNVVITVVEDDDPGHVKAAVDLALSQPVAGAIVLEFDRPGMAALKALPATLPVTVAGATPTSPRDVPVSSLDARQAAKEATRYLLGLGHRTVHHIGRPPSSGPAGRSAGWREALIEAGLTPYGVLREQDDPAAGFEAAGLLLRDHPDMTALFCANDNLAFGAMRRILEAGLRIPQDISVMGFEGSAPSAFWNPPLTTTSLNFEHIGRGAARLLFELLERGQCPMTMTGAPELIIRASTAPPSPG
ncbi:MAG: LacI family transcriptional regulator [Propionibacteriaceae bacterium]|jgi:DNA-binding LacI/PurR family transcriptional regulator|nr:LacI family transcriptional regulator [Propionibacteriaceae bacterium]